MMWDLPIAVEINGKQHPIRNKCDYRVVLDAVCALNDNELTDEEKVKCALFIFYEDISAIDDFGKTADVYRCSKRWTAECAGNKNHRNNQHCETDEPENCLFLHRYRKIRQKSINIFC